jgi:hypothetical protein
MAFADRDDRTYQFNEARNFCADGEELTLCPPAKLGEVRSTSDVGETSKSVSQRSPDSGLRAEAPRISFLNIIRIGHVFLHSHTVHKTSAVTEGRDFLSPRVKGALETRKVESSSFESRGHAFRLVKCLPLAAQSTFVKTLKESLGGSLSQRVTARILNRWGGKVKSKSPVV